MPAKSPRPAFVDDYLPALLAQTAQLLLGEFLAVLAQDGFTVSEWRVLATLSDGAALSIGRVSRITTLKQSTVTRVLDRMESKGLTGRVHSDVDRRVTLVRITADGAATARRLVPLAREHERRMLRTLEPAQVEGLKSTLRRLIELHGGVAADGEP